MKETEQPSRYDDLEKKTTREVLKAINKEDQAIAKVVEGCIDSVAKLVENALPKIQDGGRLFYIGAGTSGRLGILDASECPPTFGATPDVIIGLIAGGDRAIRNAIEKAEDNPLGAWEDLKSFYPTDKDVLVGIAASGSTPYVVGGLKEAQKNGLSTGCITCVSNSKVAKHADFPIIAITGPEVVTGSTRMKAGTAQKLLLNMISTSIMIGLGRVEGNRMVDMQLSNEKLVDRGQRMLMDRGLSKKDAAKYLDKFGSVRKAWQAYQADSSGAPAAGSGEGASEG